MKRALAFTLMVLAIMIIAVSCEEPHVHDFATEWSYDDTYHWYASTCGHEEVSEKGEHVWKEGGDDNGWITEKEATETEKGSAYRICTVCGYKGTKDIQKLSHVHTYSSYSSNSDKHWRTCTDCGETFSYTHTFSTYVDGGTDGHYPKCNCGYTKSIEAHVYTGTQKYMSEAVYDICDKCAHQQRKTTTVDTTTGLATAGAETKVTATEYKTETVKVATADGKTETKTVKVNNDDVDITVESSAVKTTATADNADEGKTKVTFPAGALKIEDGATSVSLIVESAPAAVASNADYQVTTSTEVNNTDAVVAGFEFKLEGAIASDLTTGSSKDPVGTKVTTYIAKGLDDTKLSVKYVGTNKGTDPKFESYNKDTGELVFTVYHFSKYVVVTTEMVATDNLGNMYSDLKEALDKLASNASDTDGSEDDTKVTKVTLLRDVTLNLGSDVTMSKSGTLDFNGKKVTFSGSGEIVVSDTNNLTIDKGSSVSAVPLESANVKIGVAGSVDGTYYTTLEKALNSNENNETVTLLNEITLSKSISFDKTTTINLNGKTVTVGKNTSITDAFVLGENDSSYTVTVRNGSIKGKTLNNIFTLKTNAGLTLDTVTMEVECKRGIQIKDTQLNANVNVKNSTLEVKEGSDGVYVIATNANVVEGKTSEGITVKIENSTLEASSKTDDACGSTALLLNVPGTYTITDSTITGERQAAIFRGGTYTVSGSTFEYTINHKDNKQYESSNWGSGNDVPNAAIVIGNRSASAYEYPTKVTFSGTNKLTVPESSNQLYIYQALAIKGKDRTVTISGIDGSWTVNENINGAEYPLASITKTGKTTYYSTLSSAVLAAADKDEVKLLVDAVGSGLRTPDISTTEKENSKGDITINLNGHTYTMRDPAVGSKGYETQAMHWGPTASSVTLKNGKFKVSESANNVKMAMQSHTTFTADTVEFDFGSIPVEHYGTFKEEDYKKFDDKEVGVFNNNKGKTMTLTDCKVTLNSESSYGITADDAEKNNKTGKEYGGELVLDNTVVNGKVNLCSTEGKLTVKGENQVTSDQVVSYFDEYTVKPEKTDGVVTYTLGKTE